MREDVGQAALNVASQQPFGIGLVVHLVADADQLLAAGQGA